jgi:hypothetical protein
MTFNYKKSVIYGDTPFIEDMGVLTTLCLLHDEVLLFRSKSLGEHLNEYWEKSDANGADKEPTVVEQAFQVLLPEGVISFLSPSDASARFQGDEATVKRAKLLLAYTMEVSLWPDIRFLIPF